MMGLLLGLGLPGSGTVTTAVSDRQLLRLSIPLTPLCFRASIYTFGIYAAWNCESMIDGMSEGSLAASELLAFR